MGEWSRVLEENGMGCDEGEERGIEGGGKL